MIPPLQLDFRRTPVTLILAAVIMALELACTIDQIRVGERMLALDLYNDYLGVLPRIWAGQWWRPFTSTLLHGDMLHALFNVYWLVRFGAALEDRYGSYRILGLMVLLAYVEGLPQFIVSNSDWAVQARLIPSTWPAGLARLGIVQDSGVAIVGFSGVNYGLFGILMVGRLRHRELDLVCDAGTVKFLLAWLGICYVLTYAHVLPVANTAHVSGLAFGALYGLAIFDVKQRPKWIALSTVLTLIVLALLIPDPLPFVLLPVGS